jgi:hypothetical protein
LPLHIPRRILLRNPVLELHDSARGIAVHDERDILERLDKHTPAVMQQKRRTREQAMSEGTRQRRAPKARATDRLFLDLCEKIASTARASGLAHVLCATQFAPETCSDRSAHRLGARAQHAFVPLIVALHLATHGTGPFGTAG